MNVNKGGPGHPITVVFVDPLGSHPLTAASIRPGIEDELRFADGVVRSCANDHGADRVQPRGAGYMMLFQVPRSAISCAVAFQRHIERYKRQRGLKCECRIGITTGGLQSDPGRLGEPGDVAMQLAGKARPGEILAASVVKELAGVVAGISFRDRGRVRLQNVASRTHIHEIVWRTEDLPALPALLPLERTPFVGRDAERTKVLRILDEAAHGRGSLLLITGEAGIGKTRFADEVAEQARRRGLVTLFGRCHEMEELVAPYVPVLQILSAARSMLPEPAFRRVLGDEAEEVARIMPEVRRLYPGIAEPADLPPGQERPHLLNSVRAVLRRAAEMQPLLLVVDDLQWADESSLLLLEHLAESINDVPVLIIGLHRDDQLDLSHPLTRTRAQLVRRRLVRRITLKPLTRGEVQAMLEGMAGEPPSAAVAEAIHNLTEGNPFFVEEVVKHLSETGKLADDEGRWRPDLDLDELEVPENIRLVVDTRLERLGDAGRRVLTIAAVIGRDFDMRLLQELSVLSPDGLSDQVTAARNAHLVEPTTGQATFTFAHELIRHTLLAGLSLPQRQQLHADIAAAMERVYAGALDDHAVALAHHLYLAGAAADQPKLRRYLTLAGNKALAMAAFSDALRHYQRALSLKEPMDPACRSDLRYREGLAYRSLGELEQALDSWREALTAREETGSDEEVGGLCREMALQLLWCGRWTEAFQMATRGLAALGDRVSVDRGRLQCMIGRVLSGAAQYQEANEMIRKGLELAEVFGDRRLLIDGLVAKTQHHYFYTEFEQAVEVGHQAAELLREIRLTWELAELLGMVESALWQIGRAGEAIRMNEELQPLARRHGNVGALVLAGRLEAMRVFGDNAGHAELERYARADIERCKRGAGLLLPQGYLYLGKALFCQGRWDEALVQFQEGYRHYSKSALAGFNWAGLFLHLCYMGDSDVALPMFEQVRQELPQPDRPSTWGEVTMALAAVEGLAVLGERDTAAELYPMVLGILRAGMVFRFDRRLVESVAGMAAAAAGRWDEAVEHHRIALSQAEQLSQRMEQPEARRFYAETLIARDQPGDRERARELLREAIREYRRIGMPRHERLARATLARARAAAGPGGSETGAADGPATAIGEDLRPGDVGAFPNVFRREGDYWRITHEGRTSLLRNSAGLRYLAWLLQHPGRDVHVSDLVQAVEGGLPADESRGLAVHVGDLSVRPRPEEAEEIHDARAIATFRQRIADLTDELREAERWHDAERASQKREEIDALEQELARGRGLAGRGRQTTTTTEKTRVAVTKAIRGAMRKIAENQPALGLHLHNAVKTGQFCRYAPDPTSTVDWQL